MAEMTLEQVRDAIRNAPFTPPYTHKNAVWADAIGAAIKQREQDAKDAERYRWLRNKSGRNGMPYIRCEDPPFEPMDYWITAGTADSCIDRAIAQEAGNE